MELTVDSFKHLIVPPIESIDQSEIKICKPVHERYYEEKYLIKEQNGKQLDIMLRVHTNKLILVYIASGHDICKNNKKIKNINFKIGNVDRSQIKLFGKAKKGAMLINPNTKLCVIETEDGEEYSVYTGISGKLIEVNDLILENHNLILEDNAKGFLAIILPSLARLKTCEEQLISKEQYCPPDLLLLPGQVNMVIPQIWQVNMVIPKIALKSLVNTLPQL